MRDAIITGAFIPSASGRLFVIVHHPPVPPLGAVLVVPPFAEEMNKCRAMVAEVARGLALRGWATIIPDLYGTGDSEGEFRDSDWNVWDGDLASASAWSADNGWPVKALLCIRTGCLLGAGAVSRIAGRIARTVFWQPVTNGDRFLTQFLRVRVAASMMSGSRENVTELRDELNRSQILEVAGYELTGRLASQLESLRLERLIGALLGELHWIEVVRGDESALSAGSQKTVEAARAAGTKVAVRTLSGEPFWTATEIVRLPALVSETIDVLSPAV